MADPPVVPERILQVNNYTNSSLMTAQPLPADEITEWIVFSLSMASFLMIILAAAYELLYPLIFRRRFHEKTWVEYTKRYNREDYDRAKALVNQEPPVSMQNTDRVLLDQTDKKEAISVEEISPRVQIEQSEDVNAMKREGVAQGSYQQQKVVAMTKKQSEKAQKEDFIPIRSNSNKFAVVTEAEEEEIDMDFQKLYEKTKKQM